MRTAGRVPAGRHSFSVRDALGSVRSRRRRLGERDLLELDRSGRCEVNGDDAGRWQELTHDHREHAAERWDGRKAARRQFAGVAVQEVGLHVRFGDGHPRVPFEQAERGAHHPGLGHEERGQGCDRGQPGERAGVGHH